MPVGRTLPIARFLGHRGGNVTMIFALSAIPMILVMGAAVDYTRTVTKRTSLQQATDATVLAVAHDLAQALPAATVASDAARYFAAAVDDANAWIYSGPTVSPDNTQVCLTARTKVQTLIMPVAGAAGMTPQLQNTVVATSCARINNTSYEIALALDNSGSMAAATNGSSKIDALRSAAQQLVGIMNPTGQVPKTSFSLVPFNSTVNVGAANAAAGWMDTAGASSIHWQNFQIPAAKYQVWTPTSKFDLFTGMGTPWKGCVEERPAPYMTSDAAADPANPDTLFVPYLWPDEGTKSPLNSYLPGASNLACSPSVYAAADAPKNTIAVTNVIANTPRGDTQTEVCKYKGQLVSGANSAFTNGSGTPMKADPNLLCEGQQLTPLTNDSATLTGSIATMVAEGDTNLIGGFMWAWRAISPNGPFKVAAPLAVGPQNAKPYGSSGGNVKAIVLMTDGFNHWASTNSAPNISVYSSLGYFANGRLGATSASNYRGLMDQATLSACSNAKAAGIQVFTVGFSIPNDPIDAAGLSLLQSCASQPSMSYVAQDGTALIAAFKAIGATMSGLRLVN